MRVLLVILCIWFVFCFDDRLLLRRYNDYNFDPDVDALNENLDGFENKVPIWFFKALYHPLGNILSNENSENTTPDVKSRNKEDFVKYYRLRIGWINVKFWPWVGQCSFVGTKSTLLNFDRVQNW